MLAKVVVQVKFNWNNREKLQDLWFTCKEQSKLDMSSYADWRKLELTILARIDQLGAKSANLSYS